MEVLAVLEKKVADLVERLNAMRTENDALKAENKQLKSRLEQLEVLSLSRTEQDEQEREVTKTMVDSLIRSIDAVVEREQHS